MQYKEQQVWVKWVDGSNKHRAFTQESAVRVLCETKSQCQVITTYLTYLTYAT